MASCAVFFLCGCLHQRARSEQSFDEIRDAIEGKSAQEILQVLGEPDTRQPVFESDERWIWWSYTFLDGNDHPPELRGQIVHLEIVFRNPTRPHEERRPYSDWRIAEGFGVRFKLKLQPGNG